jgi:hypothetical protein
MVPMLEAAKEDIRNLTIRLVLHGVGDVRYVHDLLAH